MSELITLKLPSVSVESFERMMTGNYYFVDKTALIKDFARQDGKVALITRLRRFGKTFTMSVLKSFFEMNYDDPDDKSKAISLFKDTQIFKDKYFYDSQVHIVGVI